MRRLSLLCAICSFIALTTAAPCSDLKTSTQCQSVQRCVWDTTSTSCKCGDTEADFVFLVDESGSVQQAGFDIQQQFLVDVLDTTIPVNSSVAVAKFGSGVTTVNTLQEGKDLALVRQRLLGMTWAQGATHMGDAVQRAINWLSLSTKTNKIIFLATDGKPNGGIVANPCAFKDTIANTAGLHVVVVGVSSGFDKNKVTCLVQKEGANADKWIITVAQYDRALLDAILPLLDGRFCPEGFQMKVTEIKPVATVRSGGAQAGDNSIFVEINNEGTTAAPLNKIQLSGMFSGTLVGPGDTRQLLVNQVLVVWTGQHPVCDPNACKCTSVGTVCPNALYVECTTGICTYVGNLLGYNLTNWHISISDASSSPPILVDSVTHDSSPTNRFPTATSTFPSYELNRWDLSNDIGNHWSQSCIPTGTPGDRPANCSTCLVPRCASGGDRNATCGGSATTCLCSAQFYFENGVCLSLFPPPFCTATLVKVSNNTYEVSLAWGTVSSPPGVQYIGTYIRNNGDVSRIIEFGNSKELHDYNKNVFAQAVQMSGTYGFVQSLLQTPNRQTNGQNHFESVRTNCTVQTSAPTPSPTRGTTLLWAYFGGDICTPPQDRCSCLGQQSNCAGSPSDQITKKLVGNARNFLTLVRFPRSYPHDMQIQWVVYDSETNKPLQAPVGTQRNRRLMSGTTLPTNQQVCNQSQFDVCPPWNTTILPGGDLSQIAMGVNVAKTNKQYYVRISACSSTLLVDPCIKVFPDQLRVSLDGVAPQSVGGVINSNTTPEWLWWLLAGVALLLILMLFLLYRWWTRNKVISGELDTTKKDLDQAITENELGFGHDLGGDVEFNPMATGVPGQAVVSDPYGTEIDGRRQIASQNRADVAIEKFGYRQQLGQVQQGNMGQGY